MHNSLVSTVQWHLYRSAEKLGYLGNVAIALVVAAIVAYFTFVCPLAASVEEAKRLSVEKPLQQVKSAMTDEEKLLAFQKALPPVNRRANAIQAFMDIAISENLQPNEIAYKTETRQDDLLSHYHVEFSLEAPYPDIKHFLSVLLNKLNYVSIASLTLHRDNVDSEEVEARIHLVFHFNQLPIGLSEQAVVNSQGDMR